MKFYLEFDHDEIEREIPFRVICEARYGARWDTGRRRRRWLAEFTEAERKKANECFRKSHIWYLSKGVPDNVKMTVDTYHFWQKLGDFCASL